VAAHAVKDECILVATVAHEPVKVLEVGLGLPALETVKRVEGDTLLLLTVLDAIAKVEQDLESKVRVLQVGSSEELHHLVRRSVSHYTGEKVKACRSSGTVCRSTVFSNSVGNHRGGNLALPNSKKIRNVRNRHLKVYLLRLLQFIGVIFNFF
jgi:hypothetical protein